MENIKKIAGKTINLVDVSPRCKIFFLPNGEIFFVDGENLYGFSVRFLHDNSSYDLSNISLKKSFLNMLS